MKQFEFSTLSVFLAAADAGSLSGAAQQVHLTVAAVSARIADLERAAGAALFTRHARGVALTPAGHAMVRHARTILFDVERMRAEVGEFARGVQGQVRIGANTSAVTGWLPEALRDFAREHPALRIDLEEQLGVDAVRAVIEGRKDLAVFAATTPHEGLCSWRFRMDRLCLVVPAGHRLARRRGARLADALDEDFVGLESGSSLLEMMNARAGRALRLRVQVRSFDAMCRMVEAGLGVGVLPERSAAPHVRSMRLRALPLADDWALRELRVGVRAPDALGAPARGLLDHLLAHPHAKDPADGVPPVRDGAPRGAGMKG